MADSEVVISRKHRRQEEEEKENSDVDLSEDDWDEMDDDDDDEEEEKESSRKKQQAGDGKTVFTMLPKPKGNPVERFIPFVHTVAPGEPEQWVTLGENFPGYKVSSLGRLQSKHGTRRRKKPASDGYIKLGLVHKSDKTIQFCLHVIVAKAFILNPDNKPYVNHINGVRDDNAVTNLEWSTASENNHKAVNRRKVDCGRRIAQYAMDGVTLIQEWASPAEAGAALGMRSSKNIASVCGGSRTHSMGFIWKYVVEQSDLPGEVWKEVVVNEVVVKVSSHGRVSRSNGAIRTSTLRPTANGYVSVNIRRKQPLVHRLVMAAFIGPAPPGKPFVNHKDGKRDNNHVDNLEWVSTQENMEHAIARQPDRWKRTNCRSVQQLDRETGKVIATFASLTDAERATGLKNSNISVVCSGKAYHAGGFGWRYTPDEADATML